MIGGMFTWDGPWPGPVLTLDPEHFTNQHCGKIYLAMDAIRGDVGPVDIVDLVRSLREMEYDYLASEMLELQDQAPVSCNLDHWARLITDKYHRAEILRVSRDAAARCEDAATAAAAVAMAVSQIEVTGQRDGMLPSMDDVRELHKELQREYDEPQAFVSATTGLSDVDRIVRLSHHHLTIIAGRPGMGKSALAGTIAMHAAMQPGVGSVCLFSLEMSKSDFLRRMLSACSGVPGEKLAAGVNDGTLLDDFETLYRMRLAMDDRPRLSIDAMRASLSMQKHPRIVIVDYLQLAKTNDKLERHDIRLGAITKGLKAIAKDFDTHVIALSQLNRGVETREDKRPRMSDLRNSGELEEDADNVWLLYRPAYYNPGQPEDLAILSIGKQRHGSTGEVRLRWDATTQTFSDWIRR